MRFQLTLERSQWCYPQVVSDGGVCGPCARRLACTPCVQAGLSHKSFKPHSVNRTYISFTGLATLGTTCVDSSRNILFRHNFRHLLRTLSSALLQPDPHASAAHHATMSTKVFQSNPCGAPIITELLIGLGSSVVQVWP